MVQGGLFLLAAVLVLTPIGALFIGAISSASPGTPGAYITFHNLIDAYAGLIKGGWTQEIFVNTVLAAVPSSVAACLIGTFAAWAVSRTNVPGRRVFQYLLVLPMFYSPLIDVIGWAVLADGRAGLINTLWTTVAGAKPIVNIFSIGGIILVMTNFLIPYVFIINFPLFRAMDPTLEEAAAASGANIWWRIRSITVPIMAPSILASFVLIFTLAMEQFTIPGFLGSHINFDTLAYAIYAKMQYAPAEPNVGAAAGTILLLLAVITLSLYRLTLRRAEKYVTIGGKGHQTAPADLGRAGGVAVAAFLSLVALVSILLPLAAVIFRSLMKNRVVHLRDISLGWMHFENVFQAASFSLALQNSLVLGLAAALICTALGWAMAHQLVKRRSGLATATDFLIALPIGIPGTVFGVGMLWGYVATPVYLTIWIMLIAFVTRYCIYAVRMFSAGLIQIDKSLEEAGAVAGAGPATVVRSISLPILRPVIASAMLLVFLTIMRELSSSIILYGFDTITLPIFTWDRLDSGFYGEASAISLVQMLIVLVAVVTFQKLFGAELRTEATR